MLFSQDSYQQAIRFAAEAHGAQQIPGGQLPYVVHLANVAMEVLAAAMTDQFDVDLAVTCALLHDVLEDTQTPAAEVERRFGPRVLSGVCALTKDERLPKEQRMADSLARLLR
jgi:(p)ppGpp synthase/HD superfamily hydrolase